MSGKGHRSMRNQIARLEERESLILRLDHEKGAA